jgi:hypothetical protein
MTASIKQTQIAIDFNLKTEGDLSEEDLPLASGDDTPGVIKEAGEISFGLRNLAQIERFGEAAGRSANPQGFGDFQKGKAQIEKQLGIDIDKDLIDQLTGNLAGTTTIGGKFGVRSELKDAEAFEKTLAKVAPALPRIAKGAGFGTVALAEPKGGEDFYALAQPDGDSVVFGVVRDAFVVANEPARAGKLATASPTAVSGASGSLVVNADAEELATAIIRQLSAQLGAGALLGSQLTGPLGELSGSVKTETDGMTGKLTLSID